MSAQAFNPVTQRADKPSDRGTWNPAGGEGAAGVRNDPDAHRRASHAAQPRLRAQRIKPGCLIDLVRARRARVPLERNGPCRGQHGATLVEYALGIALIVVIAIPAVSWLSNNADKETDNQAECISTRPPPASCQVRAAVPPAPGGGGGEEGGEGGEAADPCEDADGGAIPGCVPEEPPPPPLPIGASWAGSAGTTGSLRWVDVDISLLRSDSTPVEGAQVVLRFEITEPSDLGSFFADCTTNASGECTVRFDSPYNDVQEVLVSRQAIINTDPPVDGLDGTLTATWGT
jgi:Flp pilus assembly pilin Flp